MNEAVTTARNYFDFDLILDGINDLTGEVADALFEAGCDDATFGIQGGVASLSFTRAAPDLLQAVGSAIRDVRKADVGARVRRIDGYDFVTEKDVCEKTSLSLSQLRELVSGRGGPGGFPTPLYQSPGAPSVWRWKDVSAWLARAGLVDERADREAREMAALNAALELSRLRESDEGLFQTVASVLEG